MPENSLIRAFSVLAVMLVFGLGWYGIARSRLGNDPAAKARAAGQAKYVSLVAAFLYLIGMVSIASLFL